MTPKLEVHKVIYTFYAGDFFSFMYQEEAEDHTQETPSYKVLDASNYSACVGDIDMSVSADSMDNTILVIGLMGSQTATLSSGYKKMIVRNESLDRVVLSGFLLVNKK